MPTPATHLALAQEMLRRNDLSPAARRLLKDQQGPFLLGHTAPDVKTVSGQERETSHFYTIPRTSDRPAYQALFDAHPELACADRLSTSQATFVAGYIAHLSLDELWLDEVFRRYFLQDWGPLRDRLFLHNVLRTWLDAQDRASLEETAVQELRQAELDHWLPFIEDEHLRTWRDWLIEQLAPGQTMETAAVFAERLGVQTADIEAVVQSPGQMEKRVFGHFPRYALHFFREQGYKDSVRIVDWYLGGPAVGPGQGLSSDPGRCQSMDVSATQETR